MDDQTEGLMDEDAPLFPVAGWAIGTAPEHDIVIIRLAFLSHATQRPEEADPGRRYVFSTARAKMLRDALDRLFHRAESAGPPPPPTGTRQ